MEEVKDELPQEFKEVKTKSTTKLPMVDGKVQYPEEFEKIWRKYAHYNAKDKGGAYSAFSARVNEGVSPEQMYQATCAYLDECERKGTEHQYIKMCQTFLGVHRPYDGYITATEYDKDGNELVDMEFEGRKFKLRKDYAEYWHKLGYGWQYDISIGGNPEVYIQALKEGKNAPPKEEPKNPLDERREDAWQRRKQLFIDRGGKWTWDEFAMTVGFIERERKYDENGIMLEDAHIEFVPLLKYPPTEYPEVECFGSYDDINWLNCKRVGLLEPYSFVIDGAKMNEIKRRLGVIK